MEAEEGAGRGARASKQRKSEARVTSWRSQTLLSGFRGWGRGRGRGPIIIEVGGLPDLQRCGVPPVQADRRALWLSF